MAKVRVFCALAAESELRSLPVLDSAAIRAP